MTLRELVVKFRKEHGISQRQFANMCDLSNGYISMLERNINPSTGLPLIPSLPSINKIAHGMGMTVHELLLQAEDMPIELLSAGEGEHTAIIQSSKESTVVPFIPVNAQPMPNFAKKPRLGVIACGEPILAEQNIQSYDDIPDWVKCDFTLVCKGDSMIGAHIMDGAVVCIRSQPEVEDGQIAAVIIDDLESEATLKRVKYYPDHIELRPENPSFRPLSFWDEDMNRVRVIGKAVYCINTL